jgi:hypothetical protein
VARIIWQVVAYDWGEVIAEFEEHSNAEKFAEAMDGLALRCIIRPVRTDNVVQMRRNGN